MTTPQPSSGGSGNIWSRRIGPLPMWGWGGIALLAVVLLYMYRNNKAKTTSSSSGGSSASTVDTPGGVDASLVPQFVNQVYTQDQPPAAPNITVNNQIPPPSTTGTSTPPPNQAPHGAHQYPAPQGLSVSSISRTSAKVTWNNLTSPQPAPGSYTVAVYNAKGKVVDQTTVSAPDTIGGKSTTTLTGLPNGQGPFQVHVWANGGAVAPPHASSTFKLA